MLHPKLLSYARKFHALSVWRDTDFDEQAALEFCLKLRENPDGYFECNDAGVVGGALTRLWFAPTTLVAVELFWYSEEKGEGRRLRERFEAWARERGADLSQFSCMVDERETALRNLLGRAGYTAVEIGFRKAI